ncbi:MAG: hypothetical protein U0361_25180 [Nitrospiraceae bacterium]
MAESNKPTHDICFVKDRGKDQKGYWTTIGAAWMHKDTAGLNLQFDFIPTDFASGRVVVRIRTDKAQGRAPNDANPASPQGCGEPLPYPLTGVGVGISDTDLADILGAWLADEFARDDYRHIHDYEEAL